MNGLPILAASIIVLNVGVLVPVLKEVTAYQDTVTLTDLLFTVLVCGTVGFVAVLAFLASSPFDGIVLWRRED